MNDRQEGVAATEDRYGLLAPASRRGWKCRLLGHKFKYTDQALRTHVVEFCLRCGMRHA